MAAATPISTYNTVLTITGVSDVLIKDYPDMGSDPEAIDVTTLSDPQYKYIKGLKGSGAMTFNSNYDAAVYAAIDALTAAKACTLTFSDGSSLSFTAWASVRVTGKGANESVDMAITLIPTTAITHNVPVVNNGDG